MTTYDNDPQRESIRQPAAYGTPTQQLTWREVDERLATARHYWLATTRPDGRPHVVPVDGIRLDGACYFGGAPETVHARNLRADPRVVIHLDGAEAATIAEGVAAVHAPTDEFARELDASATRKYGYSPGVDVYLTGVWRLRPTTVLAWTEPDRDATRFRFTGRGPGEPHSRGRRRCGAVMVGWGHPQRESRTWPLRRRGRRRLVSRRHSQRRLPARPDPPRVPRCVAAPAPDRDQCTLSPPAGRRVRRGPRRGAAQRPPGHDAAGAADPGRPHQRRGTRHVLDTDDGQHPAVVGAPTDPLPPVEECIEAVADLPNGIHVGLLDHLDLRLDLATVGWFAGHPAGQLEMRGCSDSRTARSPTRSCWPSP